MANFAFVRSVGTPVTATGTTVSLTVGASGAAIGDLVAVFIASTTATNATSVTDTGSNTYIKARAITTTGLDTEIWVSRLTTALVSTNLINVNFGGSQAASVCVLEFSGGTGTLIDRTNAGVNAADVTPGSVVTPSATRALVLGLRGKAASGTEDIPNSVNYTAGASKLSSIPTLYAEYSILTASAARTLSGQWSASGSNASVNVAMFNVAPIVTPRQVVSQAIPRASVR